MRIGRGSPQSCRSADSCEAVNCKSLIYCDVELLQLLCDRFDFQKSFTFRNQNNINNGIGTIKDSHLIETRLV
jgi:hypothetical protein